VVNKININNFSLHCSLSGYLIFLSLLKGLNTLSFFQTTVMIERALQVPLAAGDATAINQGKSMRHQP
jgi:hypothetical protein